MKIIKLKTAFITLRSYLELLRENVQKVSQKLTTWIGKENFFPLYLAGKEVTHSLQKNKFLVITFKWIVCFG